MFLARRHNNPAAAEGGLSPTTQSSALSTCDEEFGRSGAGNRDQVAGQCLGESIANRVGMADAFALNHLYFVSDRIQPRYHKLGHWHWIEPSSLVSPASNGTGGDLHQCANAPDCKKGRG